MDSQPSQSADDVIYCSACGHQNHKWHTRCRNCGAQLPTGAQPPPMPQAPVVQYNPDRPGCVTAYAILIWIGAGLITLLGVAYPFILSDMNRENGTFMGVTLMLVLLAFAALYAAVGVGLWRLKNWARIVVIVVQSLGILSSLISLCLTLFVGSSSEFASTSPVSTILGGIIGVGVSAYIIYWFTTNANYFS